jgi:hypothetical protein
LAHLGHSEAGRGTVRRRGDRWQVQFSVDRFLPDVTGGLAIAGNTIKATPLGGPTTSNDKTHIGFGNISMLTSATRNISARSTPRRISAWSAPVSTTASGRFLLFTLELPRQIPSGGAFIF